MVGSGPLFLVVLATMMLPGQVTLIPIFIVFKNFGWIDTRPAIDRPSVLWWWCFLRLPDSTVHDDHSSGNG